MTCPSPSSPTTFHPFPRLPKELRLSIWELAVPRERLIKLTIHRAHGRRRVLAAEAPRWLTRNALNKPITGPDRYCAVVHPFPSSSSSSSSSLSPARGNTRPALHSKFLRVTREARAVALAFYRVHIPVYLTGPTRTDARVPLLFNPEHDTLHVAAVEAPIRETLVDFLWDLRAYDPRGVGLQRLAVDLQGLVCSDWRLVQPADLLLVRQRAVMEAAMRGLREVWFVFEELPPGPPPLRPRGAGHCRRHCCAAVGSVGAAATVTPTAPAAAESRDRVPRMPVAGGAPTFERRGLDVRPGVEQALERVYMGEVDPRELVFRWRKLERTWRGGAEEREKQAATEYRVLVSKVAPPEEEEELDGRPDGGGNDGDAAAAAAGSAEGLNEAVQRLSLQRRHGGGEVGEEESRLGPTVPGFWLFPTEAVGEIDDRGGPGEDKKLSEMPFSPGRVLDLRQFRPTLAVSG